MQSPRLTLVLVFAAYVMDPRINAAATPSVWIDTYRLPAGRSTFTAPGDDLQVALNTATGRRAPLSKWLAFGFRTWFSSQGDGPHSVRTTPSPVGSGASILTPRISRVITAGGYYQSESTGTAHHNRIYRELSIAAWSSRLPISHRNLMNHRVFWKRKDA